MNDVFDDPPEFTDDQLRAALKRVGDKARRAAFAAGRSVMIVRDNQLVLLHPDGTEEIVPPTHNGEAAAEHD